MVNQVQILRYLLCDTFEDVRYVMTCVKGEFQTHPYLSLEKQLTVGVWSVTEVCWVIVSKYYLNKSRDNLIVGVELFTFAKR
jgi:hypothetical protein